MAADPHSSRPGGDDIRPIVAQRTSNRSVSLFVGAAALGAGLLFYTLENRRASSAVADIAVPVGRSNDLISSPPPLDIPADYTAVPDAASMLAAPQRVGRRLPLEAAPPPRGGYSAAYAPIPQAPPEPFRATMPGPSDGSVAPLADGAGPAVVFSAAAARPGSPSDTGGVGNQAERVTATRFQNPSTTIPKGTVIQAVLETALDSTRAGFARAIVSRDTFGFDGTQSLIPRGSRLVGEYKADIAAGQKRALIQWQQLMRPDGVIIHLDSPAADPLGRAGVEGKVNSHFLERFSGAILQSALSIGVELATQSASRDSVIVAVPGSLQGVSPIQPDKIQPTVKVRNGTSVSVFVSRDLDFTTVTP
ncbi:MAG: conjugation TrbI family protein [Rhizorhabdus sp.]|nr:conjugation TrbI family protein [Rhizorhabdus sp.]